MLSILRWANIQHVWFCESHLNKYLPFFESLDYYQLDIVSHLTQSVAKLQRYLFHGTIELSTLIFFLFFIMFETISSSPLL